MQTWALPALPQTHTARPALAAAADCLSAAIEAIGEPHFGTTALHGVNAALNVDFWSVYCLYGDQEPHMFLSGSVGPRDVSPDCFRRYRQGLYRRDRTLAAAGELAHASNQPAMTLWNEAEIPSPHRDQIYRQHGIHERLSIVAAGAANGTMAMNLYRFESSGGFRDGEVEVAQLLARSLLSCVKKHLQNAQAGRRLAARPAAEVRALLLERDGGLTARELDVCERLLRGWTYEGIAHDLGLSVPTVKTYRARAFDRLEIHFRNELFALVGNYHA